ncbi:short-chain dehydrogenase [Xylariales sp. AK1849]|nr:short-chain dehydrogenase [Xylariales sp. AK1849]
MSSPRKLTILITGCSPGGMGAALALAFHAAGHHVYATARNPSKMSPLASQGIDTLPLDVTSAASIAAAANTLTRSLSTKPSSPSNPSSGGLDILINNAGGHYTAPISDASLESAKTLFDLNVWAQLAVTQAFLPLLLKSVSSSPPRNGPATPMIVNHTSVGSVAAIPFQSIYSASKAAFARLSDGMRLELAPFGIRVVELKTAMVQTNFIHNSNTNNVEGKRQRLPEGSLYEPAREVVEWAMSQEQHDGKGTTAEQWANDVMGDLMQRNPPAFIWRGESAFFARIASVMPQSIFDGFLRRMTKLNKVEEMIKESKKLI